MQSIVYKCDECKSERKIANHWFILYEAGSNPGQAMVIGDHRYLVAVAKWDDDEAAKMGRTHICGELCLSKRISRLAGVPQPNLEDPQPTEEQSVGYASMH